MPKLNKSQRHFCYKMTINMRVALAHLSLNFLGGEEKLCLSFIDALKKSGHRVTLFTLEKTDWEEIMKFFGDVGTPDEEIFVTSSPIHSMFSKAFIPFYSYVNYLRGLVKLVSRREHDIVINTYGDVFTSIADLSYVHFPIGATFDYRQIPAFSSQFKWATYSKVYKLLGFAIEKVRPSVLLTNSKFTYQVIKKYLKRDAVILHPPVSVKDYLNREDRRKNYVVTVSKFTPKRHLHRIPLVASKTKNAKFIVTGVADEYSVETLRMLRKTIKACKVKDRVLLRPNIPRQKLINLLSKAKVYLHTMPFEHFGISIIEAMAAGCVPVVHRSGGPWLDILMEQQGEIGFSYETIEEAAQIIDLIICKEDLREKVSRNARKRAMNYDTVVFERRLNAIIKSYTEMLKQK